jgi:hypothetical protein
MTNIAIETGDLEWIFPLKMVIFHSYVSLPEGTSYVRGELSVRRLFITSNSSGELAERFESSVTVKSCRFINTAAVPLGGWEYSMLIGILRFTQDCI